MLRKMKGLPQRDIAVRLGISENTVEKHMVKALKYLGQALAVDLSTTGRQDRRVPGGKEAPREK